MRTFFGVVAGALIPAALLVSPGGATVEASSGDTCAATGGGTSYTLTIALPPNASPQGGFAFGAPGITVTNINIAGTTGTLSTQNLPPNTSAQWLMSSTPKPGESVAAVLTTSGPVSGAFTVVATSSPPTGTPFEPFTCALSHGAPAPSNVFTVNQHVSFDSAAGAWHLIVAVPGAGTVTGIEALPAAAGSGSKAIVAPSLIQSRKVVATSGGKFTLSLRPTARGSEALEKTGSIKVRLTVAFNPKNGKSASKVLNLRLKK